MVVCYWIIISILTAFLLLFFVCNCTSFVKCDAICSFFKSNTTKYILKRLLISIVILFSIITITFYVLKIMPNDNSDSSYLNSASLLKYYRDILPYPKNVCVSYHLSDNNLVCSVYKTKLINLGSSSYYMKNIEVWTIIKQKCFVSFVVGIIAYILECIINYPLAIYLVLHNNKRLNRISNIFYVLITSIPLSLIYYMLLLVFMLVFKLPITFEFNNPISYIAPIASVCFTSIALVSHWIKIYIMSEWKKDYVTYAFSKGLDNKTILNKHVFRNALIPLIRTIPSSIVYSICGFYLLESTFGIPGSGSTLITAIKIGDANLTRGLILFFSFLSILAYFLGDVISAIMDPRIKYEGDGINEKNII